MRDRAETPYDEPVTNKREGVADVLLERERIVEGVGVGVVADLDLRVKMMPLRNTIEGCDGMGWTASGLGPTGMVGSCV